MNDVAAGASLRGVGVLVTRPPEQAAALLESLDRLGARALSFPALAILPPRDSSALDRVIAGLDDCRLAIFISPSAARQGVTAVRARRAWPHGLSLAAIGKGTAQALHALGLEQVLAPASGADSEHLLVLPELQRVAGQRIVIFRGEGGRETLAETLRARGALVSYAECYRRGLPEQADPAPILAAFRAGGIHAVTAYSSETLDNLFQLLGETGAAYLRRTPLFVPHARIAAHARSLGCETVITGQEQLISRLVEYFTHD